MREWLYGRNAVLETLRSRRRDFFRLRIAQGVIEKGRLEEIIQQAQALKVPVEKVDRTQLDPISSGHQGVALEVSGYPYLNAVDMLNLAQQKEESPFILVLDSLQDPQNLGTLLRTAEAVGVHGVVLPLRRTASVTAAVVNASSGASEHLMIAQANLAQVIVQLKEAGLWIIGLEGSSRSQDIDQVRLDGPTAVVVGSEGEGMRRLVSDSCDVLLRLPMCGKIESLNAAVAGSVVLYFVWQRRGFRH
jgi:23S rRNA (guanosine2251-2'-O)-methyltransferase